MSPNLMNTKSIRQQQGFLLPLALFILVVMGALALTISRTATQTQNSSIQEFTNIQAFYAAESGAQRGMQALFLANATRQATDSSCAAMAINHNFAGVDGLKICTVAVRCTCLYQNGSACAPGTAANYSPTSAVGVTKSFYTVNSEGSCGPDQFRADRRIQVGAYREQE
jgi:MSHA biogenesis protein MshP